MKIRHSLAFAALLCVATSILAYGGPRVPVDLSHADIYQPYLNRTPLSGWWKVIRATSDGVDRTDDPGHAQGFTKADYDDSEWTWDLVPGNFHCPYGANIKKSVEPVNSWGGVAYFRREFQVPEVPFGHRAVLVFEDVNGKAEIFVNGKTAGSIDAEKKSYYTGPEFVHEFNVTGLVDSGKKNQITIRYFHDGYPRRPWGWGDVIGILGLVYLDIRPEVYADEILVTPQPDLKGVKIECLIGGADNPAEDWTGEIFEWENGIPTAVLKFEKEFRKDGYRRISGSFNLKNPKLWSCESPFLYGIRIKNAKGEVAGVKRFGVRTFQAKDGAFLLNGKPMALLGITHQGQEQKWFTSGRCFAFAANPNNFIYKYWKVFRTLNINHIRQHSTTLPRINYDMMDEVGILMTDELSYPTTEIKNSQRADKIASVNFSEACKANGDLLSSFEKRIKNRLYRLYSHPCVCTFSFGNEIRESDEYPDGRIAKLFCNMYDLYKRLDEQKRPITPSSGRVWDNGSNLNQFAKTDKLDYLDTHDYTGSVDSQPISMCDRMLKTFHGAVKACYKSLPPVINGECVSHGGAYFSWLSDKIWSSRNAATPNWNELLRNLDNSELDQGVKNQFYHMVRNFGTKNYVFERDKWCGIYAERILEIHRRNWPEMAGFESLGGTFFKSVPAAFTFEGDFIVNERGKHVARACAPAIAVFDYVAPNRYSGEELKTTLYVVNNKPEPMEKTSVVLRLKQNGKILAENRIDFSKMLSAEKKSREVILALPSFTGECELEYELFDGEQSQGIRAMNLHLRNRAEVFAPIPANGKRIAFYGSEKFGRLMKFNTLKFLKKFKVPFTRIGDFRNLEKFDILILGNETFGDAAVREDSKQIRNFAENGGRVLVFEQNVSGRIPFLEELEIQLVGAGQFSEILQFNHSSVKGLCQEELHNWNQGNWAVYHRYMIPLSQSAVMSGGNCSGWGANAFGMVTAHVKCEKGDILLTQAEVTALAETDSGAAKLLRNLLETILDDLSRSQAAVCRALPSQLAFDPPAKPVFISLKSAANAGLADEEANDRKGGWSDQGPTNDLRSLPVGKGWFADIPFEVIDPASNGGKTVVIVSKKEQLPYPAQSMPITIGLKAKRIFFLHGGAWISEQGRIGKYMVEYASGKTAEIPLFGGENIGDWWGTPSAKFTRAICGWSGKTEGNNIVGLNVFEWCNPAPDDEIRAITIESEGTAMIGVIGITLEKL